MKHAEGARMVSFEIKRYKTYENGSEAIVAVAANVVTTGAADEMVGEKTTEEPEKMIEEAGTSIAEAGTTIAEGEISIDEGEILIDEGEILIGEQETAVEGLTDVDLELLVRQVQDADQGTVTIFRQPSIATSRVTEVDVQETGVVLGVLPTHFRLLDLLHDHSPVRLQDAEHVAGPGLVVHAQNAVLEVGVDHLHQNEATEEEVADDKAHVIETVDGPIHHLQAPAHPVLAPANLNELHPNLSVALPLPVLDAQSQSPDLDRDLAQAAEAEQDHLTPKLSQQKYQRLIRAERRPDPVASQRRAGSAAAAAERLREEPTVRTVPEAEAEIGVEAEVV